MAIKDNTEGLRGLIDKIGKLPKGTYSDGYNDGHEDGYRDGRTEGYNAGYSTGRAEGYNAGYSTGSTEGYNAGYSTGSTEGYNIGYSTGRADGVVVGKAEGIAEGYNKGREEGYNEGYNEGYTKGYNQGREEGYNEGYTKGYNQGREEGYTEGYNEGYAKGSAEGGSAEPTTPTDSRTNLAYWYGYLNYYWDTYEDPETYETICMNDPLDELEYPKGTKKVTSFHDFAMVRYQNTDVYGMYYEGQCGVKTKKFTGELDVSGATSLSNLLYDLNVLEDAGTIRGTGNVTNFYAMFGWCGSLLSAPELDTSNGTYFSQMFCYCQKLKSIPLLNLSKATSADSTFKYCSELEHIGITGTIGVALDLKDSTKLSHDTLVAILNALVAKTSGTWKLTIGSTNIAKLTQEELDIAATKGWQVV